MLALHHMTPGEVSQITNLHTVSILETIELNEIDK